MGWPLPVQWSEWALAGTGFGKDFGEGKSGVNK